MWFINVKTVGIEEPLKKVIKLLKWKSEEKAVAVILQGFGGIGKTTLAMRFLPDFLQTDVNIQW